VELPAELNERQLRILDWLQRKRFLGVRECSRRFDVSTMTLKRDFAGLVLAGRVQRVGRARATRYALR
jgi:DeoR/GlpR family transcriptional regulator of sugar metabolism